MQTWADNFLNETGYFAELKRLDKDPEAAEGRIRSLRELMATMDGIGNAPAERLENFLENVTLDGDREEEKENTSDAVTLITMHSCKGLEFPHVFVVGLEDGLLPHTRSKVEGTMDEERRLFYVEMCIRDRLSSSTPAQPEKKDNRLPIDTEARKKNRTLPTPKVLELLKTRNPGLFNLAEVVGKWVWIQFDQKQPVTVTSVLSELGFHWNNKRQSWQHPCGIFRDRSVTIDPRKKFGSYFAADVKPA